MDSRCLASPRSRSIRSDSLRDLREMEWAAPAGMLHNPTVIKPSSLSGFSSCPGPSPGLSPSSCSSSSSGTGPSSSQSLHAPYTPRSWPFLEFRL